MTGIIHLFWSVAVGHGPAGALLGWLALCGAADVAATVLTWLTDRAASLTWAIRTHRDDPAPAQPLARAHREARDGAGDLAPERD